MTTPEWTAERKRLQDLLVKIALDLAAHTGSHSFSFAIPNITPKLYIAMGEAEQIRRLVE